jgi:hypothetical protein
VAVQFAGPYHASKYAIEAIGDCLRQEPRAGPHRGRDRRAGAGLHRHLGQGGPAHRHLLTRTPEVDRYRERLRSLRESLQRADEKGASPDDVAGDRQGAHRVDPSDPLPVGTAATFASAVRPWIPDKLYDAVVRRAV